MPFLTTNASTLYPAGIGLFYRCPPELMHLVDGACQELCRPENWESFGTASPAEMAEYFTQIMGDRMIASPIGTIVPTVSTDVPDIMLPCDGATYQRVDYPNLYSVLPSALITGTDTFVTPDLNGRFLLGGQVASIADMGGQETVTLDETMIPAHSHGYTQPVPNIDIESPGAPDIIAAGVGPTAQTSQTGQGQPHENMPPYFTVRYMVVAK